MHTRRRYLPGIELIVGSVTSVHLRCAELIAICSMPQASSDIRYMCMYVYEYVFLG